MKPGMLSNAAGCHPHSRAAVSCHAAAPFPWQPTPRCLPTPGQAARPLRPRSRGGAFEGLGLSGTPKVVLLKPQH